MSLVVSLLQQRDFCQARTLLSIDPTCIKVGIEQTNCKSSRAPSSRTDPPENDKQTLPKVDEILNRESFDQDDNSDPTIFYALGDVETLELLLLLAPQSAWAQNRNGERPLHAACQIPNIHEDVISILLFAFPEGASAKNRDGKLALHFAVANIHDMNIISTVHNAFPNAVAEREAKNGSKPLHYACAFKAPLAIVQYLCEKHGQAVEQRNRQGNLPLHLSLMYDAPDDVKRLLIDLYPNAVLERDSKGRLPLHIAAQCQSISVQSVEALLSVNPESINDVVMQNEPNDASVDTTINCWLIGKKCIHIALRFLSGRADIIRCLLSHSAFKEVVKKSAISSISQAVRKKALLITSDEHAGKINTVSDDSQNEDIDTTFFLNGDTLLHTALEFNASIEVLETITSLRPSSLKEVNNDGKLPIHFAAWRQVDADTMVFLIRSFPESLILVDEKTGNVALHYALQYLAKGNCEADTRMVEKVLSYMASACFVVNKAGFYPIHLAARAGCPYHIIDAMLKVVPYSFGLFSENRMRLLPIDFAIACKASADVIGLLLGYSDKGDAIHPKRIMDDRQNIEIPSNSVVTSEATLPPTGISLSSSSDEGAPFSHMSTLMDAHLGLQQKFTLQGEEMRKLRARMHSITADLQSRNDEIKGYKKDVSWGKDRIKLLEREITALTTELATFK